MLALRVVEHLDVIEHVLPCICPGPAAAAPDPLALEQVQEALGDGVVVTVAAAAHRMLKIVGAQERSAVHAGKLAIPGTLFSGLRRQTAMSKACKTTSVVCLLCIDQPTTRREKRSMTSAR